MLRHCALGTRFAMYITPRVRRRRRLADFSTERLMGFLTGLGRDIEIVVKMPPRSRKKGRLRVAAA